MNNQQKNVPQNVEAEESLLGTILLQDKAIEKIIDLVEPEDFYRKNNKIIFATICELFDREEPHDLVTVTNALRKSGKLDNAGGAKRLTELTDVIPFTGMLIHHAKIIKEKSVLRQIINISSNHTEMCYACQHDDVSEILDRSQREILGISINQGGSDWDSGEKVINDAFLKTVEMSKNNSMVTGVPSGFTDLDRMTSGFQPGDMVVLAGRPSMGKTALCMNFARSSKVPVAIFSLEMSKQQMGTRLISDIARVDSMKLRNGTGISEEEWRRLENAKKVSSNIEIHIDDTPSLSILEMRARARSIKKNKGVGLIIIDYLQLMTGSSKEGRVQEVSAISRGVKAMAKELDVPVIALSQLNRSLESRTDKRPILSDLKESGSIEQDADVVMFIYRDEVYNKAKDNPNLGLAELIVGKQRNGPIGTVGLAWLPQFCTYTNLARS